MGSFSYTTTKAKKLSLGNRVGYLYKLINVQTTGSVIHTPFRMITGVLMSDLSPTDTCVVWSVTPRTGPGTCATVNLSSDAEAQANCVVTGLL